MQKNKRVLLYYYLFACFLLIFGGIWSKSDIIGIILTVAGITAGTLNVRANKLCFVFYLIQTSLYAYVAFKQKFYGEAVLNALILTPMYAYSLVMWLLDKQKLKNLTVEIYRIKRVHIRNFLACSVVVTAGYGYCLDCLGSSFPYWNAFLTTLCAFAGYLTSHKIKEQWYVWIIYSLGLMVIWSFILGESSTALSIVLQNFLFLGVNLFGMQNWNRLYRYLSEETEEL